MKNSIRISHGALAKGFPPGKHRLEIVGGPNVPIAAIRVYRPPQRPH